MLRPPEKKNKKWCNFVRFTEYFAEIMSKKICKNIVIFYIKIIDNVLLCTIFRELQHTPQISCHLCDLVCYGVHFL